MTRNLSWGTAWARRAVRCRSTTRIARAFAYSAVAPVPPRRGRPRRIFRDHPDPERGAGAASLADRQDERAEHETIVVDGVSQEATVEIAREGHPCCERRDRGIDIVN